MNELHARAASILEWPASDAAMEQEYAREAARTAGGCVRQKIKIK
jgi:hypothetical protein